MELVNKLLVVAVSSLVLLSCFSMEAAATVSLNRKAFLDLLNHGDEAALAGVSDCVERSAQPNTSEREGKCVILCKDIFKANSKYFKMSQKDFQGKSWYQEVDGYMNENLDATNKCEQCYIDTDIENGPYKFVSNAVKEIRTISYEVKTMLKEANLN